MRSSAKVVAAGLISAFLQFALAVLGWGGWRPFFAHPAFVALTWLTVAMMIVVPFTSGNTSPGIREDRSNRWVFAAFSVIAIVNAYFPAYTDRLNYLTIDGEATRWAGVALYVVGGALRILPVFVLGNRFSGLVAIQPGHTLETRNIYKFIRNPSYLGLLIGMLGWGLTFRSWIGVFCTAIIVWPLIARMHSEECLLGDYFGAEYKAYFARTWRLIPGLY